MNRSRSRSAAKAATATLWGEWAPGARPPGRGPPGGRGASPEPARPSRLRAEPGEADLDLQAAEGGGAGL